MTNEPASSANPCGEDAAAAVSPGDAGAIPGAAPGKPLTPEAERALLEAAARREAAGPPQLPPEIDGRGGEEPTRFGDWERRGIAVDF